LSIEARIYEALTTSVTLAALVGTRIYPIKARQNAPYPVVVYKRDGGEREYGMDGSYSTLENAAIELSIHATAVTARRLVSDAAISALSSATAFVGLTILSPTDHYNDEVSIYTRTYSVSIWNRE